MKDSWVEYSRYTHADQILVSSVLCKAADVEVGLAQLMLAHVAAVARSHVVAERCAQCAALRARVAARARVGVGGRRGRRHPLRPVLQQYTHLYNKRLTPYRKYKPRIECAE